jgi:hypothetical protein
MQGWTGVFERSYGERAFVSQWIRWIMTYTIFGFLWKFVSLLYPYSNRKLRALLCMNSRSMVEPREYPVFFESSFQHVEVVKSNLDKYKRGTWELASLGKCSILYGNQFSDDNQNAIKSMLGYLLANVRQNWQRNWGWEAEEQWAMSCTDLATFHQSKKWKALLKDFANH